MRIFTERLQGYGGPTTVVSRAVYKNRLLEERKDTSEFCAGVTYAEMKEDWAHRYVSALEGKAAESPAASPTCDFCGGDTLDGCVSQSGKHWCKACEEARAP